MVKQLNIVSFDRAKRESSSRPISREQTCRTTPKGTAASRVSKAAAHRISAEERTPARVGVVRSSARKTSSKPSSCQRKQQEEKPAYDEFKQACSKAAKEPSAWAKKKAQARKKRADKKFNKQFGGAAAAPEASGSRAAVYKGEMGTSHKRAAKMQNQAKGAPSFKRKQFMFSSERGHGKLIASATVMVCLALSCWFLYAPAQQLYHSVRDRDRLQAEYSAIEQRNNAIQSKVDYLGTDDGVEDQAHRELGWVKDGQQTGKVYGLNKGDDDSSFTANIVPGSIAAPSTWYSALGDALFGAS